MLNISRGILLQVIKNPDVKYFNKPSAPWEKPKGLQARFCSAASVRERGKRSGGFWENISDFIYFLEKNNKTTATPTMVPIQ